MEELFNVQFIEKKCIYSNTSAIHTVHFLYVIKSSESVTQSAHQFVTADSQAITL